MRNTAILIPTRDRPSILANTLAELTKMGFRDLPLWVYDDASDNPAAISQVVGAGWPGAEVIRGTRRAGQAEGRNVLMRACEAEFGIMLDDDQYFLQQGSLADHILRHTEHPYRAVVQFLSIVRGTGETNFNRNTGAQRVPSFMGGSVLAHIPSLMEVGGYRSCFIYGHEETDLAMRLWGSDLHIWYDPSIIVEHNQFHRPEERRDYREYDYLYARNSVLLATMNMPLWLGLPIGVMRSLRRALLFRRNYRTKAAGLLCGIGMTFSLWRERTPLPSKSVKDYWRFSRKSEAGSAS